MEHKSAAASGDRSEDLASAAGHLKSSWQHGKEAAQDARRIAAQSWNDLAGTLDGYVTSRPKTVALGALGAGLVLGFLTGTLASRSRRAAPSSPSETH